MIVRLLSALFILFAAAPVLAQSCDTSNRYNFTFSDQAAATLAYGSTYNYTATSGGGATRAFSMQVQQNGLSSTQAGGDQMPAISTLITGSASNRRDLIVGGVFNSRTSDITSSTRVITVTFTFAAPVRELAMTVHDIDFASNQYRDWLAVSGANGSNSYSAELELDPQTTSAKIGATSTPVTIATGQAVGTAASDNNSDDGTVIARFAQPVTSVTLKYGNYPLQRFEFSTGQQGMGIAGFSFCPMPSVSLAKNSTPAASALGAYNLPDTDVVYTLRVSNTGGSTVDAGSIVLTDVLPANISFRNSAFDGTTTLPVKLVGSAGVALASADVTYRRTGTTGFNYIPVGAYDPLVAEIRIAPTGTMSANSTFSIQFVGKIK